MSPETNECKVALADDHVLVRTGIANLINNFEGFKVVIEASTGEELLDTINRGIIPDMVLLDLNMPGMGGRQTAMKLISNYPEIRILMLSMFATEISMIQLIAAGAAGFLKKDSSPMDFKVALKMVWEIGSYQSNSTTYKIIRALQAEEQKKEDRKTNNKKTGNIRPEHNSLILSEKELIFLRLVCTNLTYTGIAGEMNLTGRRAVDCIREKLFLKLDLKCRTDLAMFAVRNGIASI